MLHGNTEGLSPSASDALSRLYRRRAPLDVLVTPELARALAEVSRDTGRQVGVIASRRGEIEYVVVGDSHQLFLPDLGRMRASEGRFRGLRLIHTHLTREGLTRDDIVDLTRLHLDMVIAICVPTAAERHGAELQAHYAYNVPPDVGAGGYEQHGPLSLTNDINPAVLIQELEDAFAKAKKGKKTDAKDGRAILLHVTDRRGAAGMEASLAELAELAATAGVQVVDKVTQVREKLDPKFVIGRGKVDDVVLRSMALDADVLIFDRNLSPAQAGSLAEATQLRVIDRTQLILDIFAQRAESRDGKLQVELAQMKYLLPRLGQKDDSLSRLSGGIGGRGPGETTLEIGKRRARERISRLEAELKSLAVQRKQRRNRRTRRDVPIVSIVGYTNAGKSTLLNTLTESTTVAENKLFATLDTRSRRIRFPEEREIVLTDTVGFIRDLPKDLFAAFRATFEETEDADLLLHVIDASDPNLSDHIRTTETILSDLQLQHIPTLLVFNKADRLPAGEAENIARGRDGIAIAATHRESLRELLRQIEDRLFGQDSIPIDVGAAQSDD